MLMGCFLGMIGRFVYLIGLVPFWPLYIFRSDVLDDKNRCHYNSWQEIGRVSILVSMLFVQVAWLLFLLVQVSNYVEGM